MFSQDSDLHWLHKKNVCIYLLVKLIKYLSNYVRVGSDKPTWIVNPFICLSSTPTNIESVSQNLLRTWLSRGWHKGLEIWFSHRSIKNTSTFRYIFACKIIFLSIHALADYLTPLHASQLPFLNRLMSKNTFRGC